MRTTMISVTTKTAIARIATTIFSANAQAQQSDEAGEPWFDACTAHSGPKDRPQMAYVALAIGGGRWYGPRPSSE